MEDLVYALVQVAHNFGAAMVVGGSAAAVWFVSDDAILRRLALLVAVGWALQAASGAAFGATSFYYYGEFPDIHGTAIAALVIKVLCAMTGFVLAVVYMKWAADWEEYQRYVARHTLFGLGALAFTAAAFLRWFS
ncbi:MAG: hypothetical protein FD165_1407 [Gammaproteobacteria bacterium]|nr:MAG: hypothetical protein FD165_1407 [Gammaproteobacteria bacterium]TND04004.1 MAG: hypothetical protein FD120_1713 [Gammaproteobacteria bacterium]